MALRVADPDEGRGAGRVQAFAETLQNIRGAKRSVAEPVEGQGRLNLVRTKAATLKKRALEGPSIPTAFRGGGDAVVSFSTKRLAGLERPEALAEGLRKQEKKKTFFVN